MKKECLRCHKEFEYSSGKCLCSDCLHPLCEICGKEIILKYPYTQHTCSQECRNKWRIISGAALKASQAAVQTKLKKYGTVNVNLKPIQPKKCKECGELFTPRTNRQVYCDKDHYRPCPVCGKPVLVKDFSQPAATCSQKCRTQKLQQTCLEKYGNINVLNSQYGREKSKQTSLKHYGVDHPSSAPEVRAKRDQTCIDRYGTKCPMQNPDVRVKAANTCMEKYGVVRPSQAEGWKEKLNQSIYNKYGPLGYSSPEIKQRRLDGWIAKHGGVGWAVPELRAKRDATMVKKYGEHPYASLAIRDNMKKTCIERYGVEYASQSQVVRQKINASMIERYGVSNIMELSEYREKAKMNLQKAMINKYGSKCSVYVPEIKNKISHTISERYGVPWFCMTQDCCAHNNVRVSSVNKAFARRLADIGLTSEFEYHVGRKAYDLLCGNTTLIEIDPTYTHNAIGTHWGPGLDHDYHIIKTQLANQNGYRCIHIFDWDNWDRILQLLKPKTSIYARNCYLAKVDQKTAEIFTQRYHLQGSCRGQKENWGLYYKGELVEIMTFGKPRYNKKFDFELLRLCTKDDLRVVGGASRLFKAFLKEHPAESIISYCDLAKFSGEVYSAIGFTLNTITNPAKIWSKEDEYITDNLLRQRGYDQLFGANYGKGTSNEELMLDSGWLPVYDCGQAVYVALPASQYEG